MQKTKTNKIAIAFGFGRESYLMYQKLKKQKPTLITCLGEEDDIDENVVKLFARSLGLKVYVIKNKEGFNETWDWYEDEYPHRWHYNNSILKYFKSKKPFDVLYVGRRKIDLLKRSDLTKKQVDSIEIDKIKNVRFPCWNI